MMEATRLKVWSRAAMAGMLGLAALGGGGTPTQARQVPDLVLLDVFPSYPAQETHGSQVEAVLRQQVVNVPIHRMQVDLGDSMADLEKGKPGALDRYIESRFVTPTSETAHRLEVLASTGHRYVIGQSQGASDSRVVDTLWDRAQHDAKFRGTLCRQLHLRPSASNHDLLSGLVGRTEHVHHRSAAQQRARQELLQAADRLPTSVRVLSGGNQGVLSQELAKQRIAVDAGFYRSDLEDPHAVIVGASDARTGRASIIASPNADATVGANGVEVAAVVNGHCEKLTGSSFAQPQVSGGIETLLKQHPQWSRDDVTRRLVDSTHHVAGEEPQLGAGVVDHTWLLAGRPPG